MDKNLNLVVLAGGRGKRMKSSLPKPLKKIGEKSMLQRIVKAGKELKPIRLVVVESNGRVKKAARRMECITVRQKRPLGTADALKVALGKCTADGNILVTCADIPLISPRDLKELLLKHCREDSYVTVLAAKVEDPSGYGRLVIEDGRVEKIVEEKEATPEEKNIDLVNSGIYCFKRKNLKKYLNMVEKSSVTGEYYLTDLVEIVINKDLDVHYEIGNRRQVMGVNTPEQLEKAHNYLERLKEGKNNG